MAARQIQGIAADHIASTVFTVAVSWPLLFAVCFLTLTVFSSGHSSSQVQKMSQQLSTLQLASPRNRLLSTPENTIIAHRHSGEKRQQPPDQHHGGQPPKTRGCADDRSWRVHCRVSMLGQVTAADTLALVIAQTILCLCRTPPSRRMCAGSCRQPTGQQPTSLLALWRSHASTCGALARSGGFGHRGLRQLDTHTPAGRLVQHTVCNTWRVLPALCPYTTAHTKIQ